MSVNLSNIVNREPVVFTDPAKVFGGYRVSAQGAKALRLTLVLGATGAGTLDVQHSAGFNLWQALGSQVAIPASAGLAISAVSTATNTFTSVGNAPESGEPVVFSSGTLPAPLEENTVYYAIKVDADNFQLSKVPGGSAINLSSAGSSLFFAPLSYVHFVYTDKDVGWVPPMGQIRAVIDGTNTQLLGIIITQGE